jgi:hypothetical protein
LKGKREDGGRVKKMEKKNLFEGNVLRGEERKRMGWTFDEKNGIMKAEARRTKAVGGIFAPALNAESRWQK